jgi:hypothetical protein
MRLMTRWPLERLVAAQFDKAGDIALPNYDLAGTSRSPGSGVR